MKDTTSLHVGQEALYSLVSKLIMASVGFGGTLIFARVLGPNGLGVYQSALAVAFVFAKISDGIAAAVRKRVSEVNTDPSRFFGGGLILYGAIISIILSGLFLLVNPAIRYFGDLQIVLGAFAVVSALGLFNIVNHLYAGIGYPARSSWIDTIRSVLTLLLQLIFLSIGLEVFGLLIGLAFGTFVAALISVIAAGVQPEVPKRKTIKRIYTFARWTVPTGLLTNFYSSADIIIITTVVGSAATGQYTVAMQLVMPAALLASSIRNALGVQASGRSSVGQAVDQDLINAISYTGLFAIPILFGALAMPQAIPRTLFGSDFSSAGAALVGMALFQVGNVYAKPFEATFEGIDRPGVIFRVNMIILLIHLPLAVLLGMNYGLVGVVGATVFAEGVRIFTYQYIALRQFNRIIVPKPVGEQLLSALLMFLALKFALIEVSVRNWIILVALVGGGAVLYFAVLLMISSDFRITVNQALPFDTIRLREK